MRISDWSSDVCSSDLVADVNAMNRQIAVGERDVEVRIMARIRLDQQSSTRPVGPAEGIDAAVGSILDLDAVTSGAVVGVDRIQCGRECRIVSEDEVISYRIAVMAGPVFSNRVRWEGRRVGKESARMCLLMWSLEPKKQ